MSKSKFLIYYLYSLLFCLRYLNLNQALKIPILIHPSFKIGKLKRGQLLINGRLHHSMIVLGFPGTEGRNSKPSYLSIHQGGQMILGEGITMAKGTRIVVERGTLEIGNNFFCNSDCFFYCNEYIKIGVGNMYGWNVQFNTSDGHPLVRNGVKAIAFSGPIVIGNHVWIASNVHIAKNVEIASGCVVAQQSLLVKSFLQENSLIGGVPGKIIKQKISWSLK